MRFSLTRITAISVISMSKHPGGRPLKFKSSKELLEKAQIYFEKCIQEKEPITITGLAMALDTFRDVLIDYGNGKYDSTDKEFSNTVKKIKQVCENYAETRIFGNNPTGAIFALKNYGWVDKKEVGVSGSLASDSLTAEQKAKLDKLLND